MDFTTFLEHFDTIAQAPNGIAKLRSLILDLAVRGKLVPQNPEDESAQELLKEIASIRKQLAQESIKGLPTTTTSIDDDLEELPVGWQWVKVGNLTQKLGAGSTPKGGKQVYVNSGIKFIRSQNVWNDGLRLDDVAYISPEIHQKMNNTIVQPGDVLLNITGASIGRSALVSSDFDEANVIQHVAIVRPILQEMNQWIHLYLISPLTFRNIMDVQVGISREGLSMTRLKDFFIPLPPLAEQKRIVEKVDELMVLCDRYQSSQEARDTLRQKLRESAIAALMNAETDEELQKNWSIVRDHWETLSQKPEDVGDLRRSILELAVRGKLVPQKTFEEPAKVLMKQIQLKKQQLVKEGKIKKTKATEKHLNEQVSYSIPESWDWVAIDVISDIGTGSTPLTSNTDYYEDGSVPWITSTATSQDSIYKADTHITELAVKDYRLKMYPPGCLIIALYGQGKTRGQISTLEISATINQACAAINLIEETKEHKEFIRYVFKKKYEELRALAAGGAQPNLNVGKIKETLIPLPPLEEQKRIVAKVDELMQMCDRLEESLRQNQQRLEAIAASAISHLTV